MSGVHPYSSLPGHDPSKVRGGGGTSVIPLEDFHQRLKVAIDDLAGIYRQVDQMSADTRSGVSRALNAMTYAMVLVEENIANRKPAPCR